MTEFQPGCPARAPPCPLGRRPGTRQGWRDTSVPCCVGMPAPGSGEEEQDQPSLTHSPVGVSPPALPQIPGAAGPRDVSFNFIPKAGFAWWMAWKSGQRLGFRPAAPPARVQQAAPIRTFPERHHNPGNPGNIWTAAPKAGSPLQASSQCCFSRGAGHAGNASEASWRRTGGVVPGASGVRASGGCSAGPLLPREAAPGWSTAPSGSAGSGGTGEAWDMQRASPGLRAGSKNLGK